MDELNLVIQTSWTAPPSNVYALLRVRDGYGVPLPAIDRRTIGLREDGMPALGDETDWSIVPSSTYVGSISLLVVDQFQATAVALDSFRRLAESFVRTMLRNPEDQLSIALFSGRDTLTEVIPWTSDAQAALTNISIFPAVVHDHSSNVGGALLSALSSINSRSSSSPLPIKAVFFVSETADHAHRFTDQSVLANMERYLPSLALFTIGMGNALDPDFWSALPEPAAYDWAANYTDVHRLLAAQMAEFQSAADSLLLVGFCSSSRDGSHSLAIAIESTTVSLDFDARSFQTDCDLGQLVNCSSCVAHLKRLEMPQDRCGFPSNRPWLTRTRQLAIGILCAVLGVAFLVFLAIYVYRVRQSSPTESMSFI